MYKKLIAVVVSVILLIPGMAVQTFAKTSVDPEQEGLLTALGFLSSLYTSEGDYHYDKEITRAEFISEVMRFPKFEAVDTQTNYFNDISGHKYESQINRAAECGIALGLGTGKFGPDQSITPDEAVKVLGRVLGFQWMELSKSSEVQKGYRDIMHALDLTDTLDMSGTYLDGGDMAVLLYNMLKSNVVGMIGSAQSYMFQISDKTILNDYYDIYEAEGVLTATDKTSLTSAEGVKKGYVRIGDYNYATEGDYTDYLGSKVNFYYRDDDRDRSLVYLWEPQGDTKILRLDASEIEKYEKYTLSYSQNNGNRIKEAHLSLQPNMIYNGKYLKNFTDAEIVPAYGSLKLIDQNGDHLYETIIVKSVEYYVVELVRTVDSAIVDKYGKPTLDMSEDDDAVKEILYNGRSAELSYIQPNDVLAVVASKDQSVISVTMMTQKVEGKVTTLTKDKMQIGAETYSYDEKAIVNKPELGDTGKFYLDESGNVVVCIPGDVTEAYQYAWAMKASYTSTFAESSRGMEMKLLTADGKITVLSTTEKVVYQDCRTGENKRMSAGTLYNTYFKDIAGPSIGLIMYKTDEDGRIQSIMRAKDNTQLSEEEAKNYIGYDLSSEFSKDTEVTGLRIYENVFASFSYRYNATTKVFMIPPDEAAADDEDYAAGNSSLLSGDLRDLTVYGYNADESRLLGAIVVFMDKKNNEAPSGMYVNNALIVTGVGETVDEDGELALAVYGYENGIEKTIVFPSEDHTSYMSKLPSARSRADSLSFGDIITYTLNVNTQKVDTYLVIFKWSNYEKLDDPWYEIGNDNAAPVASNAIANCHTILGQVKSNNAESIVLNGNGDATDNRWNRVFAHRTAAQAYIVDTHRQTVVSAEQTDARPGDAVFIRNRLGAMNLMVIYR